MVKKILLTATILTCLGTTSDLSAQTSVKQSTTLPSKANFKFLEDISVDPVAEEKQPEPVRMAVPNVKRDLIMAAKASHDVNIEGAGALQIKYSLLLDVEVELIKNINLFRLIEEWYGTRYVYGGATRKGIDCSALMQVFFTSLYGIALPRTARAQYDQCQQISRTELREGDLLFFNTTGGVSHVGMYLANNKFVHSSSSNGVTISDMFDPYYASRMIGAGRVPDEHRALQTEASLLP
jgi:lipoprotein Spr